MQRLTDSLNGIENMIVEMRIYHCAPGRLPALQERFTNTTLGFFEKYGIEQIGFWTTLIGPSNHALTYLLKWESLAERETKWNAFQAYLETVQKITRNDIQRVAQTYLNPDRAVRTILRATRG